MTKCSKCKKSIVGEWWIQIKYKVWCVKHYKLGLKQKNDISKRI